VLEIGTGPLVLLTHPSLPVRNVGDLIVFARSKHGTLEWSSPGIDSTNHLTGELMMLQTQAKMLHVPFKGSSESVVAAATGQVSISISSLAAAQPLLQGGRLRALAVTTSMRVATLPGVPTLGETVLPGYDYATWHGMAGPTGMPKDILRRLNSEIVRIADLPEVKKALGRQGMVIQTGTPEHFVSLIARTIDQTASVVKLGGCS